MSKPVDKMMAYINGISKEHEGSADRKQIKSIFDGFAEHESALGVLPGLTKRKAQLAQEKVFELWNIALTGE